MIKTIIIPQSDSYKLTIPKKYIGKKLELLLYAFDEVIEDKKSIAKKKPSDFFGLFNEDEADKFEKHTQEMRNEWDRNI